MAEAINDVAPQAHVSPPVLENVAPEQAPKMQNVLISSKKPRGFYERAAKELFASGDNVVQVSALGEAIALAVELANMLEQKKAAKIVKIETKYQLIQRQQKAQSTSPGIHITLEKDPSFKCSRIIPGYVSFSSPNPGEVSGVQGAMSPLFDDYTKDTFGTFVSGDSTFSVGGDGINGALGQILSSHGQDISKYETIHTLLFAKAVAKEKEKREGAKKLSSDKDRNALVEAHNTKEADSDGITSASFGDLQASFCRLCPDVKSADDPTGTVFVDIFDDSKRPLHENNYCAVYIVAPKGSDYTSPEAFLTDVKKTAINVMTALCDYNGMVKRARSTAISLKRIIVVRVCLFSGGEHMHPGVGKKQVAESILSGLSTGYHYGPSPRLNFAVEADDHFRSVWAEMIGCDVKDLAQQQLPK